MTIGKAYQSNVTCLRDYTTDLLIAQHGDIDYEYSQKDFVPNLPQEFDTTELVYFDPGTQKNIHA